MADEQVWQKLHQYVLRNCKSGAINHKAIGIVQRVAFYEDFADWENVSKLIKELVNLVEGKVQHKDEG